MGAVLAACASAWGQTEPHLGYVYPAGGQAGTTFQILAGGQFLRGISDAYITGEGVHAEVLKHYPPLRNLKADERRELQLRIRDAWIKRWAELPGSPPPPTLPGLRVGPGKLKKASGDSVALPPHPLIDNLDNLSVRGIAGLVKEILEIKKRQLNPQIGEMALIEITIDPSAPPGDRELRLRTRAGLSNPMCFEVGTLPEVREQEPNDPKLPIVLPEDPPFSVPFVANGQVTPGDVDELTFTAKRGERLYISAQARHLVPYLADAVPGWFQAVLTVYDPEGHEAAFDDDNACDPDPALCYDVPEDGVYTVEIRDSIYRGRDDFVYRVTVSDQPSAAAQAAAVPELEGLEAATEKKHNDSIEYSQGVKLPVAVDGSIDPPGDVDVYEIKGNEGEPIVAEVYARRIGSPMDSVLRLLDDSGKVIAWNDDHDDKAFGLVTHQADSYVSATLPKTGKYFVHVSDAQGQGGEAYSYRLRISPPRPDVALRMTPSSVNVLAGRSAPIAVYAIRRDGFDGDIEVALKDAPEGWQLDGGTIPAGRDRVMMTLTAPREPFEEPVALHVVGSFQVAGETVQRDVVPCEDLMQAFAYRHLTPSQALLAEVRGARRSGPPVTLASDAPVKIPAGGSADVYVRVPRNPKLQDVQWELCDPPKGLAIEDTALEPPGVTIRVKADGDALKPGYSDNLIVQAFVTPPEQSKGSKPARRQQRVPLGALPAIPFEIVQP